jgi:hypothetical protein
MKRNLLILPALMVTAFFATTEIAKAADVSFSGQLLTRYESNEHGLNASNNFDDASDASDFTISRIRLNADVAINESTSAFIQLSRHSTWGSNEGGQQNNGDTNGGRNGSFQVSDNDALVGMHQAYFTLKNFANTSLDLKLGRQQIVLDCHRLFGNTIWTVGQQTHDAVRLDHKHDNMSFSYAWIVNTEGGTADGTTTAANATDEEKEIETHMAYFKYAGILGGNFSATYAGIIDPCGTGGTACATENTDNDMHTIGVRQAGQLYGIDYRGEYYYQFGDADQDADTMAGGGTANGQGVDRDAYMFGVRIGKKFANVNMKPSLTLWYDYLSGTNDGDITDLEYKSFNPVFDTGHKFYGLQDLFLGIGSGAAGSGTGGLGLQDAAIKAKLSPAPGWTLKADYHWFYTAESAKSNRTRGLNGDGSVSSALGNEIDLSLANKYNANTTITAGFSNYTTTATFRDLRGVIGDGANWAYLQFDVKF